MTEKVIAVPAEISVLDFIEEYLFHYRIRTFPVVDKDGLAGMVSVNEINSIPREKRYETKVIDVCTKEVHSAYADTPVQQVLDIMHAAAVPRVPIVDRSKPKRMVGIVSETDILAALEKERLST
jgi:predicted transcriptional regulator